MLIASAEETCPLPDDPTLAAWATALNDAGYWAEMFDGRWRAVYMTDDARLIYGGRVEPAPVPLGVFVYGPERVDAMMGWRGGLFPLEIIRGLFRIMGPVLLPDLPRGREELRELTDPRLHDLVDELSPDDPLPAYSYTGHGVYAATGPAVDIMNTGFRIHDGAGQCVGIAQIHKPNVGSAVLTRIAALGDRGHFDRMEQVVRPRRRAAALLFADLESSAALSRRLSTPGYFSLVRRMTRAADQCVIDAGGLVGRHVGDGVAAFLLAETAGSESAAARTCIQAARALREAMVDPAQSSDLVPTDLTMRLGLH